MLVVVAILAISAYIFTRYLEEQTRQTAEVSTYLSSSETTQASEVRSTTQTEAEPSPSAGLIGTSSANEILQIISDSINNSNEIMDNYHRFRRGQLDDISLEEFQLYIELLQDTIGQNVETFSTMSFSERRSTVSSMLSHGDDYEDFLNNATFHWLEYTRDNVLERVPIILSVTENGQSFLARDWVRSSLELKNFSALYFGALFDENKDTLLRIIYSDSDDAEVREEKLSALIDYYHLYVNNTDVDTSNIVSLRMDQVQFRIPMHGAFMDTNKTVSLPTRIEENTQVIETTKSELAEASSITEEAEESEENLTTPSSENIPTGPTTTESSSNQQYHTVTIYRKGKDFAIVDAIPSDTWKVSEEVLNSNGDVFLELNEDYTMDEINDKFGVPKEQYQLELTNADKKGVFYYHLVFEGYQLTLSSNVSDDIYNLERILLQSSEFSLAGRYYVGQSLRSLYHSYLFIDTLEYRYNTILSNQVQLHMQENQLKQIELLSLDYRTAKLLEDLNELVEIDMFKLPTPAPTTSSSEEQTQEPSTMEETTQIS